MTLSEAFKKVESHEFAARVGVSNNVEMLCRLLWSDEAVTELLKLAQALDVGYRIASHAVSLIKEQDDITYQNPRDTAVTTYLLVLAQTNPNLANLVAASAVNAPRLWWARKVAVDFFKKHSPKPDTADTKIKVWNDGWKTGAIRVRDLLTVSEPSEGSIIQGKFIDVLGSTTASSDTSETVQSTSPYSTNSTPAVVTPHD